jgi:hypothetical protein
MFFRRRRELRDNLEDACERLLRVEDLRKDLIRREASGGKRIQLHEVRSRLHEALYGYEVKR